MRRVVITGMGAVSPIGNTVDEIWESVQKGTCGIGEITAFDTSEYKVKLAGEVKDLDMTQYFTKRELKFNDRFVQFARIAAKQAMLESGLMVKTEEGTEITVSDPNRFGVILGSGIGGIDTIENAKMNLENRGPGRVSPFFIPMALVNLASGNVAIDAGAKGHVSCMVTACAAGTNSIGEAFHKIRDGYQDIMLAGGSEASVTPVAVAGFQSMRALHEGTDPKRASIPFDIERSGFVMGEGAAVLVLESLESAKERGAKILGEITGYGESCDAYHVTAPMETGEGGAMAMIKAVSDAGITADQVDYINAHGTSTPLNDKTETAAIKIAFGQHAYNLAVSSTKSYTGHLLGASGALESIICLMALKDGILPATIGTEEQDPACDLDIVKGKVRPAEIHYVMNNSLGFGGHNASLIFRKWEE